MVAKLGLTAVLASLLFLSLFSALNLQASGPLPNGVAAGDTTQTSTVLWARATAAGDVQIEYSTDPEFSTDVLATTVIVTDVLQPVKARVVDLGPATTYYYRLTDAAGATGQGQFRTSVPTGTWTGLRFGISGDWKEPLAPYLSIANAPERDLEFFVEHGDTIVAGSAPGVPDYRLRHAGVYSTRAGLNFWADLRSSTSILATIDDNDVTDNFAGGAHPSFDPDFAAQAGDYINETELYANALQAFQEYNPLRDELYGPTGDPRTANKRKLYRFNTYGSDAAIFLLDTRSYRDLQLPALRDITDTAAGLGFLTESLSNTNRTLLGAQQLADLKVDLLQAQAAGLTWKFVLIPSAIQNLGPYKAEDRYEGYGAERTDLLRFIQQNGIENVVFIAAGLHGTLVNNLTYQALPLPLPLASPLELTHTPVAAFEIIVGPVAIDPPSGPFGPALVEIALNAGLITLTEKALYELLPRDKKDLLVELIINKILEEMGYDLLGLAGSEINASLVQGSYVVANTYGWTEFEVDRESQVLTVTTFGIDYYTDTSIDLEATPEIMSQFVVTPSLVTTPGGSGVEELR
jgi:phosphodiesterase/alkaline phosphatase D-like protein